MRLLRAADEDKLRDLHLGYSFSNSRRRDVRFPSRSNAPPLSSQEQGASRDFTLLNRSSLVLKGIRGLDGSGFAQAPQRRAASRANERHPVVILSPNPDPILSTTPVPRAAGPRPRRRRRAPPPPIADSDGSRVSPLRNRIRGRGQVAGGGGKAGMAFRFLCRSASRVSPLLPGPAHFCQPKKGPFLRFRTRHTHHVLLKKKVSKKNSKKKP